MNPDRLARFRALLENLKTELEENLSELEAEAQPIAPDVSLGRLTRQEAMQAQNIAKEGLEQRKFRLKRVNAALDRVYHGSYGECLECGEAIAEGRLEIQPEAALCIRCASARNG